MIFPNIFKTISVRHYATADSSKIVLGIKMGVVDEIKITLSIEMFQSLVQRLNEISNSLSSTASVAKKGKK